MSTRFAAFATTSLNDGPRIPIDAERIVVVLGKDDEGRPLEISIYLEPLGRDAPKNALPVCAIQEPPPDIQSFWTHSPELIIESGKTWNTCRLSVRYRQHEDPDPDQPFQWRR
jgi:hypothetical protein